MGEISISTRRRLSQAKRLIVDAVRAADDGEPFAVLLWGHARQHRNPLLEWLASGDEVAAAVNVGYLGSPPPGATGLTFCVRFGEFVAVASVVEVVEDAEGRRGKRIRAFETGDPFAPAGVFLPDEDAAPSRIERRVVGVM